MDTKAKSRIIYFPYDMNEYNTKLYNCTQWNRFWC